MVDEDIKLVRQRVMWRNSGCQYPTRLNVWLPCALPYLRFVNVRRISLLAADTGKIQQNQHYIYLYRCLIFLVVCWMNGDTIYWAQNRTEKTQIHHSWSDVRHVVATAASTEFRIGSRIKLIKFINKF